jgi:hypothetical protein
MFTKKEGAEGAVKATVVEQQCLADQMQMQSNAIDDVCKTADGMVPTVDTQCVSGTITRLPPASGFRVVQTTSEAVEILKLLLEDLQQRL